MVNLIVIRSTNSSWLLAKKKYGQPETDIFGFLAKVEKSLGFFFLFKIFNLWTRKTRVLQNQLPVPSHKVLGKNYRWIQQIHIIPVNPELPYSTNTKYSMKYANI